MTDDEILIATAPAWARAMYHNTTTRLEQIMAEVKVAQEDLDTLSTELTDIADQLSTEITALNLPEGDLSKINAQVDRLRALEVPAPPTP